MNKLTQFLASTIIFLILSAPTAYADFIISLANTTPNQSVGQDVTFDVTVLFDVSSSPANLNLLGFGLDSSTATAGLLSTPSVFSRFVGVDGIWSGGVDADTGILALQASPGTELVPSTVPVIIGQLTINTVGLSPITYNIGLNDWIVQGEASGGGVFDYLAPPNSITPTLPNSISFNLTAVPEPSSYIMIMVVVTIMICFRRKSFMNQADGPIAIPCD